MPIIKEPSLTLEATFTLDTYPLLPEQLILSNVERGGCGIHIFNGVIGGECYINDSYKMVYSNIHPVVGKIYNTSLSYDGSSLKLYIDGNLVDTIIANSPILYEDKTIWALGANPSGNQVTSQYFRGKIYASRIYNKALTDTDILKNYQIDQSLYGEKDTYKDYLDYPESQIVTNGLKMYLSGYNNTFQGHNSNSTQWQDLTGNNNNGTIKSATWNKNYLIFNGTNSTVLLKLFLYPKFTIQTEFSQTTISNSQQVILANYETGGCGIHVKNGFVIGQCYIGGGYKQIKSTTTISTNKRYNAALSYDGTKFNFYLDGQLMGTISDSSGITYHPSTIYTLGANPLNSTAVSDFLSGNIYAVRIYNIALNKDDIMKNMQIDRSL